MFNKLKDAVTGKDEDKKDDSGLIQPEEQQQADGDNNTSAFNQFSKFADEAKEKVGNTVGQTVDKVSDLKDQVSSAGLEVLAPLRERINAWVHSKVEEGVVAGLEKLRPHVITSLQDEDMFSCEKGWVEEIVDQNWPDLIEEARFRLQMATQQPYQEVEKPRRFILIRPFYWLRAQYLYATAPYDQTFWKQRKNIFFWIFIVLKAFPYYGVQPIMFAFIFFCIDKRDEFQLVKYILDFKKMQFITQGCMQGVIGYVKYFFCSSYVSENELDEITNKCIEEGPGSDMNFYYDTFVYCLQILLIWLSFSLLPWSKQKGKPKFKYARQEGQDIDQLMELNKEPCCQVNCNRGGVLQTMLIWDILTFGIGTFTFIFTYKNQPVDDDWDKSTPYLFFGKFVYGILSFPFLFFAVPILQNLLTKSKATAYDKFGNTVPHKKNIDIKYNDERILANIDIMKMAYDEEKQKQKKNKIF